MIPTPTDGSVKIKRIDSIINPKYTSVIDPPQEDIQHLFDDIDSDISDDKETLIDSVDPQDTVNPGVALQKVYLRSHIQKKIEKISNRQRFLEHKLALMKDRNTWCILALLLVSTALTLIEAGKQVFQLECENKIYNFIPLLLSTWVTFLSSMVKIFKYQELIEGLIKSMEKCILTQSELKKSREQLHFCKNNEQFNKIKENYLVNNYSLYLGCNMEIDKNISEKNKSLFLQDINKVDIVIKSAELDKIKKIEEINRELQKYGDDNIEKEIDIDNELDI